MDQIEERLIAEVRKCDNLFNSSSPYYKDVRMAHNSWKKISKNVGIDVVECMKKWKNLRDKYVRLRKRLASGNPGAKKVPAFYLFMSWLDPHVKHRETDSNFDVKEENSSSADKTVAHSSSESSPAPSADQFTSGPSEQHPPSTQSSPESQMGQKRRRRDHDEWLRQMADFSGQQLELQNRLSQDTDDECSRFGQTVADLMRRVPSERRFDAMLKVIQVFTLPSVLPLAEDF